MTQESIFLPVLALAALTILVLMFAAGKRFRAAGAGHVTPGDFALGESANVPGHVALGNRNYMNLLEIPVLFYVVCLALYVTGTVDGLAMNLAWAYVALRLIHSLVHLTYNNVIHRLAVFAISNFVLTALWVVFAMRVVDAAA
ncbi:MAG TPA: MAPEG family protein [Caulobacteraceae bacterium]|nr:MAPEG family protein [Caulobacteraceae bacterium]